MGMISVNPRFKYGLLAYICGVEQYLYTFLSLYYFVFNDNVLSNGSAFGCWCKTFLVSKMYSVCKKFKLGDMQQAAPCKNNGRVEPNT